MPTVIFTLTFSNVAASSVMDPKPYEIGIAKDIEAFVTSAQLAKLTELPVAGGQNWAVNVTVILRPDNASEACAPFIAVSKRLWPYLQAAYMSIQTSNLI